MMKFKKFKTAAAAGLMAAVMCMGTVVSAADTPTVDAEIQKDFQIAEGITVPGITFTFTFAGVEADAPAISAKTVAYSNADTDTVTSGISSKTVAEIFSGVDFPHAGVYTYTVRETGGETSVENGTVTYDGSVYTVRVYVKNTENGGLAIDQITAAKGAEGQEVKQSEIKFVNKFEKKTNLVVKKNTVGDLADKTKAFTFNVTFTKPATYDGSTFVSGNDTYTFGQEYTFTLADGGQKVFSNLPAGTRYVVTEVGAADDGYAPSVTVVENGEQTVTNKTAADVDSLATAETGKTNLAGEGTNTVTFTNTYKDVPITGIIMNNLPFVILILAAAAGIVGYLVIRRRVAR